MRKNNRTFFALLCGGLLCIGLGVGIQLAQISALSYGGEILVDDTAHVQRMVVSLSPHAERINLNSQDDRLSSQLRELYQIQVSDSVDPGTAVVEVHYEGVPVELSYSSDTSQVPLLQSIHFYWFNENDISTLITYKDAVLNHLKQGQLCDYKLWDLREVIIQVNPKDAARISVF